MGKLTVKDLKELILLGLHKKQRSKGDFYLNVPLKVLPKAEADIFKQIGESNPFEEFEAFEEEDRPKRRSKANLTEKEEQEIDNEIENLLDQLKEISGGAIKSNPYDILHEKGHEGKFTAQFKARKPKYRHLKTLKEFAHYIVEHPAEFNSITEKRANYYINLIERANGGKLPVSIIYQSIKNGYSHPEVKDIGGGFVLDKNISNKEIQVYKNDNEKRIIVNFIGTYKAIDWANNYEYVKGRYRSTSRFKRAKDTFEKVLKDYPGYQIALIGHSQSGVITRELEKDYGDKIYEVITLNPASLGNKSKEHEYTIRSSLDVVSSLRRKGKNDITIDRKTLNPVTEHMPEILLRLDQNRQIGR